MTTTPPSNDKLSIRTIAMPADTNPNGDIFGGWLVAQMDLAAGNVASARASGRVVTVAIEGLTFHKPVFVGDEVSCYSEIVKIGRTSLTIKVDVWVRRRITNTFIKVTEGTFVFVAINEKYEPRDLHKEETHL